MSDRRTSLAAAFLDPRMGRNARLEALDAAIDWRPLAALANQVRPGVAGRPPFPALAMLKALYVQSLYDLSDPRLEEALADRLSFRRFRGFPVEARTPDETTFCRFRNDAAELLAAAFAEVNRQLEARGLIIKRGTLIDATIVQAASRRPDTSAGPATRSAREPAASFTRENGRGHFGYRMHVGVDQGSGMIRRLVLTPAHVNESPLADTLISGDEAAVYADKGSENKHRRKRLRKRGIKDLLGARLLSAFCSA